MKTQQKGDHQIRKRLSILSAGTFMLNLAVPGTIRNNVSCSLAFGICYGGLSRDFTKVLAYLLISFFLKKYSVSGNSFFGV